MSELNKHYIRVIVYTSIAYFMGFYLGALTNPDIACVKVNNKNYCGLIEKGVFK